ncbi:CCA tRNA nucleotidyltransferase [Ahrensia kielensis]|uniref:CCA tRNA nucleotidyltransferase n=1 Tax=Ahrensia kielensis TaxID=76980 RepID=UPI0004769E13|nr:CCA tRNA nucleotidyltransferase [Ahrensia kielensis]
MTNSGKISANWLKDQALIQLFDALEKDGGQARVVGGAVRNALMGRTDSDIDVATTSTPDETLALLQAADIKAIPTGIDHGTVTAIIAGKAFEITSLRKDVETDGRHAVVAFGTSFEDDAKRRDFTINAIYADREGNLYDYVGGLVDIETETLRFIGDAGTRIEEDYLRILRFFRFFAYYGKHRPDAQGLKACARLKDGLGGLSAERIWNEMRKLFGAPDPSRALLWMRQVGVLTQLLPESEKWGIDAIPPLMEAEQAHEIKPDAMIRLMSIIPPRVDTVNDIAKRWKLSNAERDRLRVWASLPQQLPKDDRALRRLAYRHSKTAVLDGLHVQTGLRRDEELASAAKTLGAWIMPNMPIKGADLMERGFEKGPLLGAKLKELETAWVESDFSLKRDELLAKI